MLSSFCLYNHGQDKTDYEFKFLVAGLVTIYQMPKKHSEKVLNALETLKSNRQFSQEKVIYGLRRVDRYIENVESDWLEQWPE
jgi:hypothetical protein